MLDYNDIESKVIFNYWNTLSRKNIKNISNNKFIKNPYIEKYIINMSKNLDNVVKLEYKEYKKLIENGFDLDNMYLYICNSFDFDKDKKKLFLPKIFKEIDIKNEEHINFIVDIVSYQINYFRTYMTITELLFDTVEEDNELYNFILVFIKNNSSEIVKILNYNIKFVIFYNLLQKLLVLYKNIYIYLIKDAQNIDITNCFLKNIFANWYNIYKKDILDDNVDNKIKDFVLHKKSILSKILCLPNL